MLTESQLADRLLEFRRTCQTAGIRLTPQRVEVLREVARSDGHPTVETIFAGVRARLPSVSLDTVYRTLWLLTDLRVIATLGSRRDAARFDANLEPHHHFVCMRCGAIMDIEGMDLMNRQMVENLKRYGSVNSAHLEVIGLCPRCENSAKSPPTVA